VEGQKSTKFGLFFIKLASEPLLLQNGTRNMKENLVVPMNALYYAQTGYSLAHAVARSIWRLSTPLKLDEENWLNNCPTDRVEM